jgi:hypothetical protein
MHRISLLGLALLVVLATPAAVLARADQVVFQIVDETFLLEFDDPCTGLALHGDAIENGLVRSTDLGDGGYHDRVAVTGSVDLYDDDDAFVGTWTYRLRFLDQFPPDGQGAVTMFQVGPMRYADGSRAIIQGHSHEVFGKGDVLKREFFKTVCGGG